MKWQNVKSATDLDAYFRERLGQNYENPPAVTGSADKLFTAVNNGGILRRMQKTVPHAFAEFVFVDTRMMNGKWLIYLSIDSSSSGNAAIAYLQKHAQTKDEKELLAAITAVARQCQKLYHKWKSSNPSLN